VRYSVTMAVQILSALHRRVDNLQWRRSRLRQALRVPEDGLDLSDEADVRLLEHQRLLRERARRQQARGKRSSAQGHARG
jgi:hypothetical protein